jgi:hypothetical protein
MMQMRASLFCLAVFTSKTVASNGNFPVCIIQSFCSVSRRVFGTTHEHLE